MDETVLAASSALRRKESPSWPIFYSGAFLFNFSARRGGDLTIFVGRFQTVMGTIDDAFFFNRDWAGVCRGHWAGPGLLAGWVVGSWIVWVEVGS